MSQIYVVRLKNARYYIGSSDNWHSRFKSHVKGLGSAWTKKWGVEDFKSSDKGDYVVEFQPRNSLFDEDIVTKTFMLEYGIKYVRGGSYSSTYLHTYQLAALRDEFSTATGKCFKCGDVFKLGHKCTPFEERRNYPESYKAICFYCKGEHMMFYCPELTNYKQ